SSSASVTPASSMPSDRPARRFAVPCRLIMFVLHKAAWPVSALLGDESFTRFRHIIITAAAKREAAAMATAPGLEVLGAGRSGGRIRAHGAGARLRLC